MRSYDVIVIGGGSGGLTAAREAQRRGVRVVLVNDGPLGGDCTYTGCVPSKALLAAADRGETFSEAMATVRDRIATIAATEDAETLRADGIEVIIGKARFMGRDRPPTRSGRRDPGGGRVDVDGLILSAPHIIVSVGGRPAIPSIPGLADCSYLTNENLFSLGQRPGHLAIIGGGAIGVEVAQAFSGLGTRVSVVEAEGRLLPTEEPEASATISRVLEARGIDLHVGARVDHLEPSHDGVRLHLRGREHPIDADHLLVATGRQASTEGLDLDAAGVETDDAGFIITDDTMATTTPGIWAIGDVTGRMPFTHAAGRMAFVAVRNALAGRFQPRRSRFEPFLIPYVIFTTPELARVGMTETEAADHGGRVAYLPLSDVDRAVITGDTDGFVKIIAGPRRILRNTGGGRVLGATIVAARAGEMIGEVALAMQTGAFAGRLAQTTQAYPTWSMAIQEAAAQDRKSVV